MVVFLGFLFLVDLFIGLYGGLGFWYYFVGNNVLGWDCIVFRIVCIVVLVELILVVFVVEKVKLNLLEDY